MNDFDDEAEQLEDEDLAALLPPAPKELRDVYILGAGFSRALCPSMPLVSHLSQAVSGYGTSYGGPMPTSGLDSSVGSLIQRNFEEALSYLAEAKPWLDETENQKHKVLLLELTRNIRFAIGKCQQTARSGIASGRCDWIVPLVEHWHQSQSIIITLNYDTLVEEMAEMIGSASYPAIPVKDKPGAFEADLRTSLRVCNIHPPILRDAWLGTTDARLAQNFQGQPSFRLLKLHGSVNWLKSSDPNAHSDTISYINGKDVPIDSAGPPPAWIADKVPFIVPPVPNKGSLVHHDSLRAIWREAAAAILSAKRLVVIGYSLPENDTLMLQLIRGNLFNTAPRIEIVNPDVKMAERAGRTLMVDNSRIVHRFTGDVCLKDFVRANAFQSSR